MENEKTRETDGGTAPFASAPERKRRWPRIVVPLAVIAIAVWIIFGRGGSAKAAKGKADKAKGAPRTIPVVAVPARSGAMPVIVSGLGTVTPLSTVTVRSRVDGQLVRVAFREGQLVGEGDVLAEIDPRPFQVQLQQAEGQLARDQAALNNAKVDLARYEALAAQDAVPRQQLDTQAAQVRQSEAVIQSDQAQVASAKLNLTYCRITASSAGRVGLRLVDPGNMVHAADPNGLAVITQLQPIAVVFTISGDQLPPVLAQRGAGRTLEVEAWDRELKNRLDVGTLEAIDNQIDPTTGTVKLKAIFKNRQATLYPNQFVNARLLVDTLQNVVLAPTAALQRSPQSTFVWVVKNDVAEMRTVEVQLTEGDVSALRRGLAPGDLVVVDGTDRLQPGAKVAIAGQNVPTAGAGGSPGQAGKRPERGEKPAR